MANGVNFIKRYFPISNEKIENGSFINYLFKFDFSKNSNFCHQRLRHNIQLSLSINLFYSALFEIEPKFLGTKRKYNGLIIISLKPRGLSYH